ncbi:MAG: hypothetical protein RSC08_03140, partial [Oscillospiraceae bacterium]
MRRAKFAGAIKSGAVYGNLNRPPFLLAEFASSMSLIIADFEQKNHQLPEMTFFLPQLSIRAVALLHLVCKQHHDAGTNRKEVAREIRGYILKQCEETRSGKEAPNREIANEKRTRENPETDVVSGFLVAGVGFEPTTDRFMSPLTGEKNAPSKDDAFLLVAGVGFEPTTDRFMSPLTGEKNAPSYDDAFLWLRELDLNQRPSGYEP